MPWLFLHAHYLFTILLFLQCFIDCCCLLSWTLLAHSLCREVRCSSRGMEVSNCFLKHQRVFSLWPHKDPHSKHEDWSHSLISKWRRPKPTNPSKPTPHLSSLLNGNQQEPTEIWKVFCQGRCTSAYIWSHSQNEELLSPMAPISTEPLSLIRTPQHVWW